MGPSTTKRTLLLFAAALLSACGSDSTSPQSVNAIVGSYTLTSVNGQKLPAPVSLPTTGAAVVTGGSGLITAYNSVSITVSVTYGASSTNGTISATGVVTGGGGNYAFAFADGTSATAMCTNSQCSVAYGSNTYVFTRS